MLSEAYRTFHGYSVGNQLLAMVQCYERGVEPGPINTYPGWQKLGRQVKRGEKALTLCMPVNVRRRPTVPESESPTAGGGYQNSEGSDLDESDRPGKEQYYTRFVYRANWFVLSQTEGEPVALPQIPEWNK